MPLSPRKLLAPIFCNKVFSFYILFMCCVLKSPPRRPVSECRIDWVAREKYGNFENKLHKHNLCKCHFRDFFLQRQTIHWRFKVSWKMKWKKPSHSWNLAFILVFFLTYHLILRKSTLKTINY